MRVEFCHYGLSHFTIASQFVFIASISHFTETDTIVTQADNTIIYRSIE